ncbi:histidine kinase [Fulvivirga imtechensis AK7]|uniref:histidine kinase n=1 Tax=Fulvivirga imtechensis AK7 TaxID=1237149 RepID=L8JKE1_9BACT|nr:histidine kinase [Fulvivirga imtechensis AK7]
MELVEELEATFDNHDPETIASILQHYRKKLSIDIERLEKESELLDSQFGRAVEQETLNLRREIEHLKKTNETVISDNYLLEYKKKDLMLLADNLEDAYEEIYQKNEELREQKKQISEQAEKLSAAHQEILKKNEELEQQKEAMLDQTDYLHEANETISKMHAEVQKQKDEILKKNEELINLNNEKNTLIEIVAHDLKSPLNQIKGMISIIKLTTTEGNDEMMKYLDTIEGSANRLNEMIGKILDIEAIESQQLNLRLENIDLSAIARDTAERFEVVAREKNIKLTTDIDDNITAYLDCDYTYQVYENLISNAVKFSPCDKKIIIRQKVVDDKALFEITDQGPGISEEDMKKLFGKFQKLSARPTGNESSTGLGLSIVKKYVEAMSGKIWCKSIEGEGATFFVEFDLAM